MLGNKVYNLEKLQTRRAVGEYFTDQNNVNFRLFSD